jgi:hypothetical protein
MVQQTKKVFKTLQIFLKVSKHVKDPKHHPNHIRHSLCVSHVTQLILVTVILILVKVAKNLSNLFERARNWLVNCDNMSSCH